MTARSADGRTRWWRRLFGKAAPPPLDASRTDLVVVASCFDDAEGCGVTLDRAEAEDPRWSPDADAVLRHHLLLPSDRIDDAVAVAGQDGYEKATSGPMARTPSSLPAVVPRGELLTLQRVQVLDVLHCSQERSRMAGLAQRREGVVLGWDALQPPTEGESSDH